MNAVLASGTTHGRAIGTELCFGATAGALATGLMTAYMLAAKAAGARGELPPRKITRKAMDAVGTSQETSKVTALTAATHLGFGMVAGAGYAALNRKMPLRAPGVLKGIAYGLLVWAGSYAGWVPALRIMPSIPEDHPSRARMMCLAHVIYGAALGLADELSTKSRA